MKTYPELPAYGRGVGGRCIIDEALYRQTELNAEMLAASAWQICSGWVGKEGKSSVLLC